MWLYCLCELEVENLTTAVCRTRCGVSIPRGQHSPGFTAIHANYNSCTSQSVLERVVIGRSWAVVRQQRVHITREHDLGPKSIGWCGCVLGQKLIPERSCAGWRRPRAWRSLAAVCHTATPRLAFSAVLCPLCRGSRCSGSCASLASLKGGPHALAALGGWLLRRRPVAVTMCRSGPWACRQQRFVICRNLGAQTLEPLIYLL